MGGSQPSEEDRLEWKRLASLAQAAIRDASSWPAGMAALLGSAVSAQDVVAHGAGRERSVRLGHRLGSDWFLVLAADGLYLEGSPESAPQVVARSGIEVLVLEILPDREPMRWALPSPEAWPGGLALEISLEPDSFIF
jgi:hypothetical protein